jgi:hypothetical protein
MSLARHRAVPNFERMPAAIVATKADRLRYVPPIDHWLRPKHNSHATVDPELLSMESCATFAFLHQRGEHAVLAPYSVFNRCTLHFASASGSEANPEEERSSEASNQSESWNPYWQSSQ